jgi:hypothetical protein
MRRREFISLLGGAAAAWPFAARGREAGSARRIGYLTLATGPTPRQSGAFERGLQELGYRLGQNVTIEYRWGAGRLERLPALARDLGGRSTHWLKSKNPESPAVRRGGEVLGSPIFCICVIASHLLQFSLSSACASSRSARACRARFALILIVARQNIRSAPIAGYGVRNFRTSLVELTLIAAPRG